ncbi:unnamed protein product [Cyprideis torosa]|uniref:Fatty acid hydroxylase domain-containing protein n=1 Tax=Cyprideis torosa TaxID=163714 RepID=A0A7R8ZLV7_9CRUS|nr:unnamed protein product [Cyprideis torosa]CAG0894151.1 unnamed protein product [Cyprideis torosa]
MSPSAVTLPSSMSLIPLSGVTLVSLIPLSGVTLASLIPLAGVTLASLIPLSGVTLASLIPLSGVTLASLIPLSGVSLPSLIPNWKPVRSNRASDGRDSVNDARDGVSSQEEDLQFSVVSVSIMVSSAFEENCSAIDNHTTMQLPWETGEELSATQVLKSVEWLFYLVLKGIGWLFYIVDPRETTFQHPEDVPFYTLQSIPALGLLIVLENVVRWLQGKTWLRTNDGVTSLSLGILYLSYKFMLHGGQIALYVWAYENFRLFDLNWTSVWTWLWAAILVDFMYYWYHRGLHEINFFWAVHQAHHSGEDFNLCTAFRITGTQEFFNMLFHLPVVILGVPPAHWFVHRQFNLLFQFYIHTEVIKGLGPLEYILNTPSHHRVHHGQCSSDQGCGLIKGLGPLEYILNTPSHHRVPHGQCSSDQGCGPIKGLGPLEYILNTPSHHRVHHGQCSSDQGCGLVEFFGQVRVRERVRGL